jgi:hypothetical protein
MAWVNGPVKKVGQPPEYFNVRTGKPCRITTATNSRNKNVVAVRSYRDVVNSYVNNPETKFNGPSGRPCGFGTRGILQRKHVIAKGIVIAERK